ncbi:MAG: dehydrogenase, partial [Longimicrobiales bacterium]
TGLQLRRDDFYRKELTFTVSCSYGPGRHDPAYEDEGHDYPVAFVRWTEQRNFEAVLQVLATGSLDVSSLVTHRYDFDRALDAYSLITGTEPSLGVILEYATRDEPAQVQSHTMSISSTGAAFPVGRASAGSVAVLGAGSFAQRTLIPAIRSAGLRLHTIVSSGGTTATVAGEKFGFEYSS